MTEGIINYVKFPAVTNSTEDGLLASGGNLEVDTLVSAYAQGIFPWFNDDQPILWWSPNPRMVLYPENIKISRSLRKLIKQDRFEIRCNTQFEKVITQCALRGAKSLDDISETTWITQSMHQAYNRLHNDGFAHSIEVFQDNKLVGGLYGLALEDVFFGESMFSLVSNASKIALSALCHHLIRKNFKIIDCQVASDHLFSMGAEEIERSDFLKNLEKINNTLKDLNASLANHQFANGIENSLFSAYNSTN